MYCAVTKLHFKAVHASEHVFGLNYRIERFSEFSVTQQSLLPLGPWKLGFRRPQQAPRVLPTEFPKPKAKHAAGRKASYMSLYMEGTMHNPDS